MGTYVEDRIYNIELVVCELAEMPHTYETILQDSSTPTHEFILRRKLNNLCKQGIIFKSNIPGTRFGKCIFYVIPKKYFILVESSRLGSVTYYFEEFEKVGKLHLKVGKYFVLEGNKWTRKYNKVFNQGSILLFI
jgi:hypothetical protein